MRIFLVLALATVAVALGFTLGRFTAAPPTFEASESSVDPLASAFDDFIRAQQGAIAQYRDSPFFESDIERAEAYRGFLYALVSSIKAPALQSHDYPRFMQAVDWTSKSGLDNPDNNYYVAMISDQHAYRITGNRGTTANLVFQLLVGQPGVAGAGTSTNVSVLYDRDMVMDHNGDFEIIVSHEKPAGAVNWMRNDSGAQTLLVRYTHGDWQAERDAPLFIERIGSEGTPAPALSTGEIAARLRGASVSLYDRTATWLDFANKMWTLAPRNSISPARPTQGGLVGQYSAFGSWEFPEDEALVISVAPAGGSYQGIELGNHWFVSLDYETRSTSLTLEQMHCADEHCYAVIAHRDPGVQNWLDTAGYQRGLIFMRWQGLAGDFPEDAQPTMQQVALERLWDVLPADTPRFSADDRRRQLQTRRAAVHRRFGG